MNRITKIILSLILLPLLSVGQVKELSLMDAISEGLENNFDVQISSEKLEIAKNNNTYGIAGLYPSLNLVATQRNSFKQELEEKRKETTSSINPGAQLNWTLFNGFKVHISKKNLDAIERLSEGNSSIVVENSVQGIILTYYNVLVQQEVLDVLDRVRQISRDRYQYEAIRKEIGGSSSFDLLNTRDNLYADSISYLKQKLALRDAEHQLNIILGDSPDVRYKLTDELQIDLMTFSEEELLSAGIDDNKSLKNQYINLEMMKHSLRKAEADVFPRLTMSSGAGYDYLDMDRDGQTSSIGNTNFYINFTLSFNLFNGGRTQMNIRNARIDQKIANIQIDKMKQSIQSEILLTYDNYGIQKEVLSASMLAAETSKMSVDIASQKYKAGTLNSLEFRTIQVQYLNAVISELRSKYSVIQSQLQLLRLTGNILKSLKLE